MPTAKVTENRITASDFAKVFAAVMAGRGAQFVGMTTYTEVKRNKSDPLYGLMKLANRNVQVGFDYEAGVNRQAGKEGLEADRVAKPRKWGVVTKDRLFVEHEGEYYLRCRLNSCTGDGEEGAPRYFLHGKELPASLVCSMIHFLENQKGKISSTQEIVDENAPIASVVLKHYMPEASNELKELAERVGKCRYTSMPKKPVSSTQAGIEKPLICNDMHFSSIDTIAFGGMKWKIISDNTPNIPASITSEESTPSTPSVPASIEVGEAVVSSTPLTLS